MKKHAIIPVFIPHRGCPNDCVFCNQKTITARQADVRPEDVKNIIETWLPTIENRGIETIEVAFFGGSFTGLPLKEQSEFLSVAKEYKDAGLIHKIHLSTRPDYIDGNILDNLKTFGTDVIELGVQSFDDKVLAASNRGHTSADVYRACDAIKEYNFELGIQLMIGLPEDSPETCLFSAEETIKIGPSIARLYPTVVLRDTELYRRYEAGSYSPLSTEQAVKITKEMYKLLRDAGINIIRMGLKSTDLIAEGGEIRGHTFHPAFRQLVEGEIAREQLEAQLIRLLENARKPLDSPGKPGVLPFANAEGADPLSITFLSSPNSFSNMVGNAKANKLYFAEKYPQVKIRYKTDSSLADGYYRVVEF
ncbi:MAG: radical SAM protein [Bacillota bacterium]|nr:radical SAM protein [Bacillota bacterium]